MNKQILIIVMTTGLGLTSVHAADTGFYIGGSFGQSKISDFSSSDVNSELASVGITATSTTDDKDTGWKAFAGYRIMKYLAVEGAYANLGEANANIVTTAPVAGTANVTLENEAWTLSALGILPLNDKFSLFARLGLNVWNVDITASGTGSGGTSYSDSEDGTDVVYGLGAAYHLTPNLNLRAEWERYDFDGGDLDFLSVGLSWSF